MGSVTCGDVSWLHVQSGLKQHIQPYRYRMTVPKILKDLMPSTFAQECSAVSSKRHVTANAGSMLNVCLFRLQWPVNYNRIIVVDLLKQLCGELDQAFFKEGLCTGAFCQRDISSTHVWMPILSMHLATPQKGSRAKGHSS